VLGEVFEDGEGGHGEDLFLAHQPHGLVAELVGVIDGSHSGARGVERARLSGGVHGHALAHARGLFHGGAQFGFGVLIRRGEFAVAQRRGRFRRS
jgi:hypothetical protein